MTRPSSLRRDSAWLFAAQVAAQALTLVTTLLIARRAGLTTFGEYAEVASVVFVATVATTFGTDMVLVRRIVADPATAAAGGALAVQLVLSLLAMALMWAAAPLLATAPHPETAAALRILSLSLLPAAAYSVATAVLRGHRLFRRYAVAGAASAAIPAAFVVALLGPGAGVAALAVILLAAQALTAALAWLLCGPHLAGVRAVTVVQARAVLRESAPVGLLALLGMVYQRAPTVAVGVVAGPAAAAWFGCASRVTDASKTGHTALYGAAYPALAHPDHAAAAAVARASSRSGVVLGVAVTALLIATAPLLPLLYGPGFEPAVTALRILAIAVIPSAVSTQRSLVLVATGRERAATRILATGVGVLAAGVALLPLVIGWTGACWAVVIAESVQAILMLTVPVRAEARARSRAHRVALASRGEPA